MEGSSQAHEVVISPCDPRRARSRRLYDSCAELVHGFVARPRGNLTLGYESGGMSDLAVSARSVPAMTLERGCVPPQVPTAAEALGSLKGCTVRSPAPWGSHASSAPGLP